MNLQNATMGNFRGKSTQVNMEKLIEVIEMIAVDIVLACCVAILFAVFVKQCVRIERCEDNMGMSEAEIQELRRRCDAYKELIEALSKSVRELNGVVEAAVKVKEQTSDNKPDTKALIGGWTTDNVRTGTDTSCISVGLIDGQTLVIPAYDTGRVLMRHGKPVENHWHGRLWTDDEGRIYEMPEGCFVLGDTPYEMDQ